MHYYRTTADGRILWGGSDGIIYRDQSILPRYDRNDRVFTQLESTFRQTFPQLSEVRFSHRWGGPVAITVPFVPYFGSLDDGRVHYGYGYNGHGVAPTHLGGKILASLVLGNDSYRDFPFVGSEEHTFPGSTLTWIGASLTRRSLLRQDRAMDRGSPSGDMDPWLVRVLTR